MVDCFPGYISTTFAGENMGRIYAQVQYKYNTNKPHIQTVYKEKLYINDSKTNSEILTFSIFQVTPIFRSKNFHYIYAMEIICAYKCG